MKKNRLGKNSNCFVVCSDPNGILCRVKSKYYKKPSEMRVCLYEAGWNKGEYERWICPACLKA